MAAPYRGSMPVVLPRGDSVVLCFLSIDAAATVAVGCRFARLVVCGARARGSCRWRQISRPSDTQSEDKKGWGLGLCVLRLSRVFLAE